MSTSIQEIYLDRRGRRMPLYVARPQAKGQHPAILMIHEIFGLEIKIYPDAEHAFFNDRRQFYNAVAAADAWTRTLDFIARVTALF
jgi:dienelactone hydrolase